MKIEAGKRYIRRDGNITGALQFDDSLCVVYNYYDPSNNETYSVNGNWNEGSRDPKDLIEEYKPPESGSFNEWDQSESFDYPVKAPITRPATAESTISAKTDKVGTGLILIPFYSLLELGKIFIEGLRYGRDNWKKGINDKEYQEERLEHALLHLIKWKEGDRSEAHLAKVAWFCFTQLELERLENDR